MSASAFAFTHPRTRPFLRPATPRPTAAPHVPPAATPDALSDLLRTVRLKGAVFYHVSFGERWAAEAPPSTEIAAAVMPGAEHVMEYHMMVKGTGWAQVTGGSPVRLKAGDVVIFPHGDGHVLSSSLDVTPHRRDADWVLATRDVPKPMPICYHHGVEAPDTEEATNVMVCGFLGCDLRPFNPLMAALPRMLHLPAEHSGGWIGPVIAQAAAESAQQGRGSGAVLERLSEMMFVDTVRRYLDTAPGETTGWLAGLRDRYVGRALALIHEKPAHPWTVDELGREIGLSRSALHERFNQHLGQAPAQYLASWRIQLGSRLLRETQRTVVSIAQDVGYESEAAFSRAFRRLVGAPPAAWRRSQRETLLPVVAA